MGKKIDGWGSGWMVFTSKKVRIIIRIISMYVHVHTHTHTHMYLYFALPEMWPRGSHNFGGEPVGGNKTGSTVGCRDSLVSPLSAVEVLICGLARPTT